MEKKMPIQEKIPATGFLRLPEVLKLFPVGRSTWWAGIESGRFPKPYKLAARISAWRVEDITKLLADPGKDKFYSDSEGTV
jgi:predicted DNA-binding transcriptional regulator AlpA